MGQDRLYRSGAILAFEDFNLRKQIELNVLKLYVMIAARRDYTSNIVDISYDGIIDYTGMRREQIKAAISL